MHYNLKRARDTYGRLAKVLEKEEVAPRVAGLFYWGVEKENGGGGLSNITQTKGGCRIFKECRREREKVRTWTLCCGYEKRGVGTGAKAWKTTTATHGGSRRR